MRAVGLPLYSLESRYPLRTFDLVGFSLSCELNYSNVLNMLDLAGIPVRATERSEGDPLVVGGGTMTFNAEPMSDFFDLFVIGEGEEVVLELGDLYRELRASGGFTRQEFLRRAVRIGGIYVPAFYAVQYHADGTLARLEPLYAGVPATITRRIVPVLPPPPVRPVVPYVGVVHDRANVEIQRGCSHGCRFCHAGVIYRPVRERSRQEIRETVAALLRNTGHEEVSLTSLSSADYHDIAPLLHELLEKYQEQSISFSLPSCAKNPFSSSWVRQQARRKTVCFAPSGSQRLRDVINKCNRGRSVDTPQPHSYRLARVKLYFMMGLPTETDEDIEAIADLTCKVRDVGREARGKQIDVSVSVATFVPKPFTAFQWTGLADVDTLTRRQDILKRRLRGRGLSVGWHDPESSLL